MKKLFNGNPMLYDGILSDLNFERWGIISEDEFNRILHSRYCKYLGKIKPT